MSTIFCEENCIQVRGVTQPHHMPGQGYSPELEGLGSPELSRSGTYTYVTLNGEFRCQTPVCLEYADAIHFRVADIFPVSPLRRRVTSQQVEALSDGIWHRIFPNLLLTVEVEMGLHEDDTKRYEELLLREKTTHKLTPSERTLLEYWKDRGQRFLLDSREKLLHKRNIEEGTAGGIFLF